MCAHMSSQHAVILYKEKAAIYWGRSTGAVQCVIYSQLNQSLLDRAADEACDVQTPPTPTRLIKCDGLDS